MADPLGLIGGGGRVNPFQTQRQTPAGGVPADSGGPSFKDALMRNINEANKLQEDAATAAEDLMSGKRNDVESVLAATQKADNAFRMLLSVRNKVMAAYDEIKQIRT